MSILTMKCLDNFAQATVSAWPPRCHPLDQRIQRPAIVRGVRVAEIEQFAQMVSVQFLSALGVKADGLTSVAGGHYLKPACNGASDDGAYKFGPIHRASHMEKEILT
ncbi:hypothetical protein [Massilia pseudoviolaceinigra]|uniref:hypothetical protein n=1 Tax=Massilia pseudoviolaceinigra TaxID=3057165 RepID=UPI002796660C|nr:hypothetical protein [Massilia sp. CCM 9206]MDQ1921699.1 hypothetical protein [Massilia sp. CCM 9206]